MFFKGMNDLVRRPNGALMERCGAVIQTRTWKHLAIGTTISAVGFSAGTWAYSLDMDLRYLLTLGGWLTGAATSFRVVYHEAFSNPEPAAQGEVEEGVQ